MGSLTFLSKQSRILTQKPLQHYYLNAISKNQSQTGINLITHLWDYIIIIKIQTCLKAIRIHGIQLYIQFHFNTQQSLYPFASFYPLYCNYNGLFSSYKETHSNQYYPFQQYLKELPNASQSLLTYQTSQNISPNIIKKLKNQNQNNFSKVGNIDINLNQEKQTKEPLTKSRNIHPNNINLILSYIRRINKSGHKVEWIINKLKQQEQSYNVKSFYSYQLYLKDYLNQFHDKNTLKRIVYFCDPSCSIFTMEQQIFYNRVCRVLIRNFLKEDSIIGLLNSKKMYKTKKIDHLRSYRIILEELPNQDQ